jgi:preprotein translocase subunit SecA
MVSKAIQRAQRQVEGQNFTIRKHLLEYDDVMNKQRTTIYTQRREILHGKSQKEYVLTLVEQILDGLMDTHTNKETHPEEWDVAAFRQAITAQFGLAVDSLGIKWEEITFEELRALLLDRLNSMYADKEKSLGPEAMREFERIILLQVIDTQWKDHLLGMDYLKEGIGLRGYGQRDPLVEYKKESFDMFQAMLDRIEDETIRYLFLIQPVAERIERPREAEPPQRRTRPLLYGQRDSAAPPVREQGAPPGQHVKATIPGRRKKK